MAQKSISTSLLAPLRRFHAACSAEHVGVEAAAQTTIRGHDDVAHALDLTLLQIRMRVFEVRGRTCSITLRIFSA